MLSLALAVCAAALVWGVADRSKQAIRELANAVRPNLLIVRSDPRGGDAQRRAFQTLNGEVGFSTDEVARLKTLPGVQNAALRGAQFFAMGQQYRIVQQVATANLPTVLGLPLERGRTVTAQEEALGLPFTVIGQITAREYFGSGDPLGQRVSTGLGSFRVVGVLKEIPRDLSELRGLDAAMLVGARANPGGSARRDFAASTVFVQYALGQRDAVRARVTAFLETLPTAGIYTVQTAEEWLGAPRVFRQEIAGGLSSAVTWTVLLALIAACANLANLFTLRVLLRRRDLALRRALGATRLDVFSDVALDLMRLGAFGSLLGAVLALVVGALLPTVFPVPSPTVLLLSVLAGLLVTALAGAYPTRLAVLTPPMVGLRDIPITTAREAIGLSGLVFGVATLIASLAVSGGAAQWVQTRIQELGGQRVVFTTITGPFDQIRTIRPKLPVNTADFEALTDPAIQRKALVGLDAGTWKYPGAQGNDAIALIAFARGQFFNFASRPLIAGRAPTRAGEATIGADALAVAFPGKSAAQVVGQALRLERRQGDGAATKTFEVVGVTRGGVWTHFGDLNGNIIATPDSPDNPPLDVLPRDLHLELRTDVDFQPAVRRLEALLTARHPGTFAPATAVYPAGDLSPVRATLERAALGYRATAVVMLLIGALGLANLMFVRVERRRGEIGVRRAVGATRQQVAKGFLAESVTLGVLGGVVGAVLGVGTVFAVALSSPWNAFLDPSWFLLALLVSAVIASLAGSLPAYLASRLAPVEALRQRE